MKYKILILSMVILNVVIISESRAGCNGATVTTAGTDENGDYCGICNDAGTCKWKLNSSGELNVYAADNAKEVAIKYYGRTSTATTYPYVYKTNAPWGGLGATSLVIGDNITTIGGDAFVGESRIKNISGMKNVKQIGGTAFHVMTSVSSLELPEGLTIVGGQAFQYMLGLQELIISDNLNTEGWSSNIFNLANVLLSQITIRCKGDMDICKAKMAKYISVKEGGTCTSMCLPYATFKPVNESQCNTSVSYYFNGASCERRPADGSSITCVDGYAKIKGYCVDPLKTFAKKRYTPAEAAQWLNEDNNTVTLTFKK